MEVLDCGDGSIGLPTMRFTCPPLACRAKTVLVGCRCSDAEEERQRVEKVENPSQKRVVYNLAQEVASFPALGHATSSHQEIDSLTAFAQMSLRK